MSKPNITLKKAGDFTPPRAYERWPGAGAFEAQKRAQRAQFGENEREALALYERAPKPKGPIFDGTFIEPYDVVKGLGLSYNDEAIWTHRVGSMVARSPNELALRKSLVSVLREDKLPVDVRGEIARRALVYYRSRQEPGLIEKAMKPGMPPPKKGAGPQPGKRGQPKPKVTMQRAGMQGQDDGEPNGKPKLMQLSQPGKPPSMAQPDPTMNPAVDDAGLNEEPSDPGLLRQKIERLTEQLHSLHPQMNNSAGHVHMHNEIKSLLRQLYKHPDPEGVREAEHQVEHFSAMCLGAPEMPEQDPNDPNAGPAPALGPDGGGQDPMGAPGPTGGPQFRGVDDKPGKPSKVAKAEWDALITGPSKAMVTLSKAFGEGGGEPKTAIARPTSAALAPHGGGPGSRGGKIVGHTASGAPIYASEHVQGGMQHGEQPADAQARLRQTMMDAMKALHEHEQAHGLPSSFNGGAPQLGGTPPGHTTPTANTVIRGQVNQPAGAVGAGAPGAPGAQPRVTLNAAQPAQQLSAPQAPAVQGAGPAGTSIARRQASPQARGQAAPSGGAPSELSQPAHGDIEDSKHIAEAVSKDGFVGNTSTGKPIQIGQDTSKMSPNELHEASQLHRAAQTHLLAAANATGNAKYKQAAKKHLDEEFRLTSQYVSHQGHGGLGEPMQKALAWAPLAAWGSMPFLRAAPLPRRSPRPPHLTLVKADGTGPYVKHANPEKPATPAVSLSRFGMHGKGEGSRGGHVIGHTRCLDAETFIAFQVRASDGALQNHKGGTIQRLYERFHGIQTLGRGRTRIEVRSTEFFAPSIDDEGRIFINRINDVASGGMRPCLAVTTEHGTIVASATHGFWTGSGFVLADALRVGDVVHIHNNTRHHDAEKAEAARANRAYLYVKHHPIAGIKVVRDVGFGKMYEYHRLLRSRAIVEASMNGLSLDEYIARLDAGDTEGLEALPREVLVHHKNENPLDDRLENFEVMTPTAHMSHHARERGFGRQFTSVPMPVTKIEAVGDRRTFDLCMDSPFHNFVAAGFVVHNSGKAIYAEAAGPLHHHFSPEEHEQAAQLHEKMGEKGIEPAFHKQQARTHRHMASAQQSGSPDNTGGKSSVGPIGVNEHERVFEGKPTAIVPHTMIQQDRPSPDDAVERSAKYMEQAQSGKGKKREPLEVWKVNHKAGGFHYALRDGNTTFQMLRKRGWTHFPVSVTKTVNEKDYTPVGPHEAKGDKKPAAGKGGHGHEDPVAKRKDELQSLKGAIGELKRMHGPTAHADEHGQAQGEGAPLLKGGLNHHLKIAHDFLAKHKATLPRDVEQVKALAPKGADVKGRVKKIHSAIGKLVRKPKYGDVSKLQDGTGMRVVVKSIQDVRDTVSKLKQKYKIIDEDNYIDKPNGHGTANDAGYRSHHLIIETPDGLQKEVQVRTHGQNAHADWSHKSYDAMTGKTTDPKQLEAVKHHGPAIQAYSRAASEWLYKKEQGQDPGPKPHLPDEAKKVFGEVPLGGNE